MRYAPALVVFAMIALVGCSTEPQPAHGMSALRIKVVAEPKAGAAGVRPGIYDTSSDIGHGTFERVDYSDLHDIVVWIEPADHHAAAKNASPVIVTLNSSAPAEGLISAVASIGQTIVFRNDGMTPVSAYSVSDGNAFNLGALAPSAYGTYIVKAAGLIELLSDASDAPIASVYAAPTGSVFLTQSSATIDVNNLMPGPYLVGSWHPRLPGSTVQVELTPDHVGHATINIGVNGLPKIDRK